MNEPVFNGILLALEAGVLAAAASLGSSRHVLVALLGLVATGAAAALAPHFVEGGHGGFFALRLLAWVVFVHAPLLLGTAAALVDGHSPRLGLALGGAALALAGVGLDAFLVEPFRLQVVHYAFEHPRAPQPLRIALVADIQSARIGDHERAALEAMAAAAPDLVLYAGDYIQLGDETQRQHEQEQLRALLASLDLKPRFGQWAVRGDADGSDWTRAFEGLPVVCATSTTTVELAPGLSLSLLSKADGHSPTTRLAAVDGLHLALAHGPDFALSPDVHADLLLAGHTHGGQVRLPFVGPLVTLTRIPRAWASGLTPLGPGRALVVSAGIGMERGLAPPLRFLCPPEIVIIDVRPAAP